MLLVKLFNFLRGYVLVLVKGYFLEKFINICTRRQIFLWDIKKVDSTSMKLKVSIKGYKALKPVARKTRCKVKILDKKGTPFIIYRYRKRKTFMIGVLLFCILLWYMSSFIWVLEISGNESMTTEEIINQLKESGLKEGTFKMGLDTDKIRNNMMLRMDRLSWIGISIKGTKALVEVKERVLPPKILEKDVPCNIVATKDGVIKELIVKSGYPVVEEGDTVKEGELLVSGVMDSKTQGIFYIHSVASVKARTWYEETVELKLTKEVREKTGNQIKKYSLKIFGNEIKLFLNSRIPYAIYDRIIDKQELRIGKNYVFPFALQCDTYEEIHLKEEKISLEEALAEGGQLLIAKVKSQLSSKAEIVDQRSEYTFADANTVLLKLTVECIEEIGRQEEIAKDDSIPEQPDDTAIN